MFLFFKYFFKREERRGERETDRERDSERQTTIGYLTYTPRPRIEPTTPGYVSRMGVEPVLGYWMTLQTTEAHWPGSKNVSFPCLREARYKKYRHYKYER